jgi:hypothetical protein
VFQGSIKSGLRPARERIVVMLAMSGRWWESTDSYTNDREGFLVAPSFPSILLLSASQPLSLFGTVLDTLANEETTNTDKARQVTNRSPTCFAVCSVLAARGRNKRLHEKTPSPRRSTTSRSLCRTAWQLPSCLPAATSWPAARSRAPRSRLPVAAGRVATRRVYGSPSALASIRPRRHTRST